jgi:acyl carrier protein
VPGVDQVDRSRVDSISENDSVQTIGIWDSVRHLSGMEALEERFGVTFEAGEISELTSYRAIADALRRQMGQGG